MTPAEDEPEHTEDEVETPVPPLRISDWLWRPWYAKLWWAAIPLFWLGRAASSSVPLLTDFYASALAGFLNVLFYPVTTLLVLGVGFVRARLDRIEWGGEGRAVMHDELFPRSLYDPYTDPGNPLSGAIYRNAHSEDTMHHR